MTTGIVGASSPPSPPLYANCPEGGGEPPLTVGGGEEPFIKFWPLPLLLMPWTSLQ